VHLTIAPVDGGTTAAFMPVLTPCSDDRGTRGRRWFGTRGGESKRWNPLFWKFDAIALQRDYFRNLVNKQ